MLSTISCFFLVILFSKTNIARAQVDSNTAMVPVGNEAFDVIQQFFNYDKDIPLDIRTLERHEKAGYVREKIVFNGTDDSRVPAYLAIPTNGKAPYPCVFLLHGIGASKEDWWNDSSFVTGGLLTKKLLAAGFAVFTLDAQYHGERLAQNDFESPEVFTFHKGWLFRARDMIVQTAVEHRRAIDYLATRTDIDTSKIGIIGYSMGGMITFQLLAAETRIKVGISSVTPILKEPGSVLAVYNFVTRIKTRAVMMLVGRTDERNYRMNDVQTLFNFIPTVSKELIIYESGHKLPVVWTNKAVDWIKKYL